MPVVRELDVGAITEAVAALCVAASCELPDDVSAALRAARQAEESPAGREVLAEEAGAGGWTVRLGLLPTEVPRGISGRTDGAERAERGQDPSARLRRGSAYLQPSKTSGLSPLGSVAGTSLQSSEGRARRSSSP